MENPYIPQEKKEKNTTKKIESTKFEDERKQKKKKKKRKKKMNYQTVDAIGRKDTDRQRLVLPCFCTISLVVCYVIVIPSTLFDW